MPLIDDPRVKTALKSRCKHGLILEYCGVCQRVNYTKEIKFPITVKDKDTGNDKQVFMRTTVNRYYIQRYR